MTVSRWRPAMADSRWLPTSDSTIATELSASLGLKAGRTAALADADLLLLALERWGEGALDRIVGDLPSLIGMPPPNG